mmetsp:Transcript_1797/g.3279  ORF Transcript_1797/g.3279 Transcript_1797/m.3279 type:complete len:361 (+) Transcript_1797:34-1116(+)
MAFGSYWLCLALAATTCNAGRLHVLMPLKVRPMPNKFYGFERFFAKHIPIISSAFDGSRGIHVVATAGVPDVKVERVANVLAEFLDNDEDSYLDNTDVVVEMERRGATMIMFKNSDEMEDSGFDGIPGFDAQDVEGDETGKLMRARLMTADSIGDDHRCKHRPELICDAPLEEVFHLVTDSGFAFTYPELFGTNPGTALTVTMDNLIGDCGYASVSNPLGRYSHFRFPDCTGRYHYDDSTCDYKCLATEYFHHFVASYNGEYPWGRGNMCDGDGLKHRSREWELCADAPNGDLEPSRQLLRHYDPDFFELFTDEFYRIPLRMPDGNYMPKLRGLDSSSSNRSSRSRRSMNFSHGKTKALL